MVRLAYLLIPARGGFVGVLVLWTGWGSASYLPPSPLRDEVDRYLINTPKVPRADPHWNAFLYFGYTSTQLSNWKINIELYFFRADHYISTPVWSNFFLSRSLIQAQLRFARFKWSRCLEHIPMAENLELFLIRG